MRTGYGPGKVAAPAAATTRAATATANSRAVQESRVIADPPFLALAARLAAGCQLDTKRNSPHRSGGRESGARVLGPRAALGRGESAALGRDRAALDAVRRRHGHVDEVALARPDLVDLRRAHARPHLGHRARHV